MDRLFRSLYLPLAAVLLTAVSLMPSLAGNGPSGGGFAAGSGLVDASFLDGVRPGLGPCASVNLDVRTLRSGRPRGHVNVTVFNLASSRARFIGRSTGIDFIDVEDTEDGLLAIITGEMDTSLFGVVGFQALVLDGGPGPEGDAIEIAFEEKVSFGGPLKQSRPSRNNVVVRRGLFGGGGGNGPRG